jgi:hypothetical protein
VAPLHSMRARRFADSAWLGRADPAAVPVEAVVIGLRPGLSAAVALVGGVARDQRVGQRDCVVRGGDASALERDWGRSAE